MWDVSHKCAHGLQEQVAYVNEVAANMAGMEERRAQTEQQYLRRSQQDRETIEDLIAKLKTANRERWIIHTSPLQTLRSTACHFMLGYFEVSPTTLQNMRMQGCRVCQVLDTEVLYGLCMSQNIYNESCNGNCKCH